MSETPSMCSLCAKTAKFYNREGSRLKDIAARADTQVEPEQAQAFCQMSSAVISKLEGAHAEPGPELKQAENIGCPHLAVLNLMVTNYRRKQEETALAAVTKSVAAEPLTHAEEAAIEESWSNSDTFRIMLFAMFLQQNKP